MNECIILSLRPDRATQTLVRGANEASWPIYCTEEKIGGQQWNDQHCR